MITRHLAGHKVPRGPHDYTSNMSIGIRVGVGVGGTRSYPEHETPILVGRSKTPGPAPINDNWREHSALNSQALLRGQ